MRSSEDVIRVHSDPTTLDAWAWDELLTKQAHSTPFMRHEYLAAMHDSGSAAPATGWAPRFVTVHRGGDLVGAAPAYLKQHSYGEYVFDWSWAEAHRRHGLRYYPKLLVAVPFTPVPGTRLMAVDDAARHALLNGLLKVAAEERTSSMHLLFIDQVDAAAIGKFGWMRRQGVQFHWSQDDATPVNTFPSFLSSLHRDKRKKIQQEMRRVADAGIRFQAFEGCDITDEIWDFFHACYESTYDAHRSTPYLNRDFFRRMAETMQEHWLMFVAHRDGLAVACSLVAIDRSHNVAYGRYWGSLEHVPCLHFDACYYQPLKWCLEQGFRRFEGGAQGEHKMARGLMPVPTASAHWLAHPQFTTAVQDFLLREQAGMADYVNALQERSPFKTDSTR